MLFLSVLACAISDDGPAPAGTPAHDHLATIEQVAADADAVAALAAEIEVLVEQARKADPAQQPVLMERIREKVAAAEALDAQAQERLVTLEKALTGGPDPHDWKELAPADGNEHKPRVKPVE